MHISPVACAAFFLRSKKMEEKFPKNLKEAIIMSVPNAMTMVIFMVAVNLWIYGVLTLGHFARVAPIMFVAAFALDFLFVGPLVNKIVNRFNMRRAMPLLRVAFMAGILTFVAPILEAGQIISGHQYLMAAPRNYIVALAVQVLVAMRVGLFVLARYRNSRVRFVTAK